MKDINYLIENGVDVNHGLELLGDITMYDSIIIDFYNAYNDRMKNIKLYKDNMNMESYAIEVHSLKSDSKYLGFTKLADIAFKHEMASKAGDVDTVNNSYNDLITEANRIILLIKDYVNGAKASEAFTEKMNNSPSITIVPSQVDENIPKKEEEKTEENVVQMISPEEVTLSTTSFRAILVADDSSIIRNFVNEIFSNEYEVLMASNGDEVINIVGSNADQIAALLLDLNMPGINGFDVLEHFKENNLFSKIPVSIISGASDKESIDKAFKYPIVDMLNKPFSRENVKNVVEKTINSISEE